ncbi:MAG TPA: methyltransferase domain-containing protein [Polyangiales bacterium]|nr:methyltransferase domain-containing protein [Polyangiales bacterium]
MSVEARYVLEHNDRELARLSRLAAREAEQVRLTARVARLSEGESAIDVGCGPLGALQTLAEVVGSDGRVVGIDSGAAAIAKARAVVGSLGLTNVELVHADASSCDLDRLGLRGQFQLAYCRLVLLHQREPLALLRKLGQLVQPGGFVAYQDILDDPGFPRCEPNVLAQTHAWSLLLALFRIHGVSPDAARDHARLARSAGFRIVDQRGKFAALDAAAGFEIVQQLLTAARDALAASGLATLADVDGLISDLEAAKRGEYRYWFGPLAVETIVQPA